MYVDDGAGLFPSLFDEITGSNIIFHEIVRLGLNMHIGRDDKPSKTETVFPPSRKTFNELLLKYENMIISSISENNVIVDVNEKRRFQMKLLKK